MVATAQRPTCAPAQQDGTVPGARFRFARQHVRMVEPVRLRITALVQPATTAQIARHVSIAVNSVSTKYVST